MDKICCFAGHKSIYNYDKLYKEVYNKCKELITQQGVNCFWVGNYGGFDSLAARVVSELKGTYANIKLELILPYITKEINEYKELYYKSYDRLLIADMPLNTPMKFRIIKCNQYMADNSDFMIAYVRHSYGGAAKTLEYAKKKNNITIFNFGEEQ